jgi:hypothetical protein
MRLLAWTAIAAASAATVPPAAAADWTDVRAVGPLVCRADFALRPYEGLLAELDGLHNDLVRLLGLPLANEAIEIYLFHDEPTYAAYLKQYLPEMPYRRALYVKGRGPGMVFAFRSPQLPLDLRHETTHALLHAALPRVPLWLDEGLAVYLEQPADRRAVDSPHLSAVRWRARLAAAPRLETLEAKSAAGDWGRDEYRMAWAWVHFLLHGPPAMRQELAAFLRDLQTDANAAPLSARFNRRESDVGRAWASHFRQWKG